MGPEDFALKTLEWLIGETLGKEALSKAKEMIADDEFRILGNRALHEAIQGEPAYIRILNSLREKGVFEVDDATILSTEDICSTLSEEDKDTCYGFIETLKRRYVEVVIEMINKNPLTKFILDRTLENKEAITRFENYVGKEAVLNLRKIAEFREKIDSQVRKTDDFVGRESLINSIDFTKSLLIEGEVGIGKSYLLMRLASIFNGQYIPLKIVNDLKTLDSLVTDAKNSGRRLFIDDLDHASEKIQNYILTEVWAVVMASRPPVKFEREITRMRLPGLEKKDIRRYFGIKKITIEDELLEKLKNDLSVPIKLRIFTSFLISRNIIHLNSRILAEIFEDVGIEGVILPRDLEDWYDNFVWIDFNPSLKKYPSKAKQALFVLSLVRVPIDVAFVSQILEVNEETASNIIESLKAFLSKYNGSFLIFHESLVFFIRKKLGDPIKLHVKIGNVFLSTSYSRFFLPRWEALYHYRIGKSVEKFEEIFDLNVIKLQRMYGFWNEALKNAVFIDNHVHSLSEKGEFLTIYGLILLDIGKWELSLRKFERALQAFEKEKRTIKIAETYMNIGIVLMQKGEWNKAEEYHSKSLKIMEEIGDKNGMATACANMGVFFMEKGEWDKAEEYYTNNLRIVEEIGDMYWVHCRAGDYMNMGLLFFIRGEWNKAEEYFRKSLEIRKRIGHRHGIAKTNMNMGLLYYRRGKWDKAEEYYKKSLEIRKEIGDKSGMAKTYSNMGQLSLDRRKWNKAEEYFFKSQKIMEEIGDKNGMAEIYMNIGVLYTGRGEWDEADKCFKKSLEIEEEMGNKHEIAKKYCSIGLFCLKRDEWNKAEEYFFKSQKIMEEIGDKNGMAEIYMNIGVLYTGRGEWDKAEEYFFKSLKIMEEIGDKSGMAKIYMNIGVLYTGRGEWDEADKCFKKSLEIEEEMGNRPGVAGINNVTGLSYLKRGEWNKAEEYFFKSLKIREEIGDKNKMAEIYMNIGGLYTEKGEWDKAEEYFFKSLKIMEEIGDKSGMAKTYSNMGQLSLDRRKWNKAEEYYKKSLGIEKDVGNKHQITQTYDDLGLLFMQKGEWNQAEEYYKKSLGIAEEIGDRHGMARNYGNIGALFMQRGEWDKAEEYYFKSQEVMEEIGDRHGMAINYMIMVTLLVKREEWNKAEEYYKKSLEIEEDIGNKQEVAQICKDMGTFFVKRCEWNKAEEYYKKSLKIVEEIEDKREMAQMYMILGFLKKLQREYQEALMFLSKAEDIFLNLGARHEIWTILWNEFECYVEIGYPNECMKKLSEMFKSSHKEDLLEKTIKCLLNFASILVERRKWEFISGMGKISHSINNLDICHFIQAFSTYGKVKLGEVSIADFRKKYIKVNDEDLLDFLDWVVLSDHS